MLTTWLSDIELLITVQGGRSSVKVKRGRYSRDAETIGLVAVGTNWREWARRWILGSSAPRQWAVGCKVRRQECGVLSDACQGWGV